MLKVLNQSGNNMDKKDVLDGIEKELNKFHKDTETHHVGVEIDGEVIDIKTGRPDLSEAMRRVDAADFSFHTTNFNDTIDAESMGLASQMRHRATMMRQRADEFDNIADRLVIQGQNNIDNNNKFREVTDEIRQILIEHAHIKPTQVKV